MNISSYDDLRSTGRLLLVLLVLTAAVCHLVRYQAREAKGFFGEGLWGPAESIRLSVGAAISRSARWCPAKVEVECGAAASVIRDIMGLQQ